MMLPQTCSPVILPLVQKRQKRKEHLHAHPPKLENVKMEVGKEAMRLLHAK